MFGSECLNEKLATTFYMSSKKYIQSLFLQKKRYTSIESIYFSDFLLFSIEFANIQLKVELRKVQI